MMVALLNTQPNLWRASLLPRPLLFYMHVHLILYVPTGREGTADSLWAFHSDGGLWISQSAIVRCNSGWRWVCHFPEPYYDDTSE